MPCSYRSLVCCLLLLTVAWCAGCVRPHNKPADPERARLTLRALGSSQLATGEAGMPGMEMAAPTAAFDNASGEVAEDGGSGSGGGGADPLERIQSSQTDRYLIRTATMQIETEDPSVAAAEVAQAVQQANGYTGELHESVDYLERRTVVLTVRIPATAFDTIMDQFGGLGTVLDRNINSQDVTEEFVDTQSRVRNLQAAEARLLDHLAESKKLSDTLDVERELTRIRGEIERAQGRLRYLSHRIDFSTITLTLQEEARAASLTPPKKYSTGEEFSAAMRALVEFLQILWTNVIWFAVWAILWVPVFLIIRGLWRKATRKRAVLTERVKP